MISQRRIPDSLMSTKEFPCGEQTLSEKKEDMIKSKTFQGHEAKGEDEEMQQLSLELH